MLRPTREVAKWVIENGFYLPLGEDKLYDVLTGEIHVKDRGTAKLKFPAKDYVRKRKIIA